MFKQETASRQKESGLGRAAAAGRPGAGRRAARAPRGDGRARGAGARPRCAAGLARGGFGAPRQRLAFAVESVYWLYYYEAGWRGMRMPCRVCVQLLY